MAGSHSTPSHAVIVSPYANEEPMPAGAPAHCSCCVRFWHWRAGYSVCLRVPDWQWRRWPHRHLRPDSGAAVRRNRARRTWARAQSGAEHGRRHGAGNDRSGARTGQSQHAARADWDRSKTLGGHSGTARSDGLGIQKCIQNAPLDSGLRSSVGPGMTLLNPDGISRADGARQRCAAPCR